MQIKFTSKNPTGWNNASGQEATQQPYPYIVNNQQPNIRQQPAPGPYIANLKNLISGNNQRLILISLLVKNQTLEITRTNIKSTRTNIRRTPCIRILQTPKNLISATTSDIHILQTPKNLISGNKAPYPYIAMLKNLILEINKTKYQRSTRAKYQKAACTVSYIGEYQNLILDKHQHCLSCQCSDANYWKYART